MPRHASGLLHDRMTESVIDPERDPAQLFRELDSKPMQTVPVLAGGRAALERANVEMGLALSADEVDYLVDAFASMHRDPTDVELMMFAQANSEHCRHKIFNASWTIDGERKDSTLFDMIRATHRAAPQGTVVAYSDNSAVLEGRAVSRFYPHSDHPAGAVGIDYMPRDEVTHTVFKVETHNHPTAICAVPGASTGAGGEIRDEGATGRGARPKAGCAVFRCRTCASPTCATRGNSITMSLSHGTRSGRSRVSRAHRRCAVDHDRRSDRCRGVQQRVRPSQSAGLLSDLRAERWWPALRLSQANHDRRWHRQHP